MICWVGGILYFLGYWLCFGMALVARDEQCTEDATWKLAAQAFFWPLIAVYFIYCLVGGAIDGIRKGLAR